MMTRVLVLECDRSLRGVLHDLLSDDNHYDVVEAATEADALAYLAAHSVGMGMVVVCSNRDANHESSGAFFAEVIADPAWRSHHQYFLLSTNPLSIPQDLDIYLAQLGATILPKPFHLEEFLTAVTDAAEHLAWSSNSAAEQDA